MDYLIIAIITLISGVVGTGIGGLVGVILKKDSNKIVSLLLSFAAGVMFSVVCFDLMTESINQMNTINNLTIFLTLSNFSNLLKFSAMRSVVKRSLNQHKIEKVVVFPKTYEKYRDNIDVDNVVVLKGKLDLKEAGTAKLLADKIEPIDESSISNSGSGTQPTRMGMIKIVIPEEYDDTSGLQKFKMIAKKHLGDVPVAIMVLKSGNKYKLNYDLWVEPNDEFRKEIMESFGDNCFR